MAPVEGLLEGNSFMVRGEVTSCEATNESTCCWEEKNADVKMISYLRGMYTDTIVARTATVINSSMINKDLKFLFTRFWKTT